jgi:hypothetical protein
MQSGHHALSRYCIVLSWCNRHGPIYHAPPERFQTQAHVQVDLPESYNVTGEWHVASNWLLSATLNSPPDVKPRTNLTLGDMFEDNEQFKLNRKPLSVIATPQGPPHISAEPVELGPSDSASNVSAAKSGASSSSGSRGPHKPLTSKELQACMAKLARRSS